MYIITTDQKIDSHTHHTTSIPCLPSSIKCVCGLCHAPLCGYRVPSSRRRHFRSFPSSVPLNPNRYPCAGSIYYPLLRCYHSHYDHWFYY